MHSLKREPVESEINGAHFVPPSKTTQLNLWQKPKEERSATFETSSLLKTDVLYWKNPGVTTRTKSNVLLRELNRTQSKLIE